MIISSKEEFLKKFWIKQVFDLISQISHDLENFVFNVD